MQQTASLLSKRTSTGFSLKRPLLPFYEKSLYKFTWARKLSLTANIPKHKKTKTMQNKRRKHSNPQDWGGGRWGGETTPPKFCSFVFSVNTHHHGETGNFWVGSLQSGQIHPVSNANALRKEKGCNVICVGGAILTLQLRCKRGHLPPEMTQFIPTWHTSATSEMGRLIARERQITC